MNNKKIAIITGGTEGLGREIAIKLHDDYEVVAISNKEETVKKMCSEIGCVSMFCDVTDHEAVEKSVDEIIKKFGKIDVLINNAGVYINGEIESNSYTDMARVVLVNVVGAMNITKAVIPYMKKQKSGYILNVSSIDGVKSKKERSVYSSSKWAITGFTECLREDLEEFNINVSSIYPGLINTGLFANAGAERDLTHSMDPSRVADIVLFMLKNEGIVFERVVFRKLVENK